MNTNPKGCLKLLSRKQPDASTVYDDRAAYAAPSSYSNRWFHFFPKPHIKKLSPEPIQTNLTCGE